MFRRTVPTFRQLTGHNIRFTSSASVTEVEQPVPPLAAVLQNGRQRGGSAPPRQKRGPRGESLADKNNKFASRQQEHVTKYKADLIQLEYREKIKPLTDLQHQQDVAGCRNLVDVRKIVELYREMRDSPSRSGKVPAGEVVKAVLNTIQRRGDVMRKLISRLRYEVFIKQNEELTSYLEEVLQDVEQSRSFLSKYAVTYLITAWATMKKRDVASQAWVRLRNIKDQDDMMKHLNHPLVVGAALLYADPTVMSLDAVLETYAETKARHGGHINLDESLLFSFLNYEEWEKAANLYADMVTNYDIKKWARSIARAHNAILTQSKDYDIGQAFLDMALEPNSHVWFLHPTAVARFLANYVEKTNDVRHALDSYKRVLEHYRSREVERTPRDYHFLNSDFINTLMTAYPEDTDAGRVAINSMLDINQELYDKVSPLLLNTVLSAVTKKWPHSPYIGDLASRLTRLPNLSFDSSRILLNSAGACDAIPPSDVAKWWEQRTMMKTPLQVFDWLSLVRAANYPDRVAIFKDALEKAANRSEISPETFARMAKFLSQHEHANTALKELQAEGKVPALLRNEEFSVATQFDDQTVSEELAHLDRD